MRNSLIIFFVIIFIVCFIGGVMGIQRTLGGKINIEAGQVLGASEFFGNSTTDLSIRFLEKKIAGNIQDPIPVKINDENDIVIDTDAGAVLDGASSQLLFAQDAQKVLPIASITKLATALVFLDYGLDWEMVYKIQGKDLREGGRIYLAIGEEVQIRDLFYLSLVGSANTATMALVHSTGMSESEFVQTMNNKMQELGLVNTHFSDPVGLGDGNVSTAHEVAQLALVALAQDDIQRALLSPTYNFITLNGNEREVKNTNVLLGVFPQNGITLLGGKTGHLNVAGYCFVGKFNNDQGREVISVILGDKDHFSRFNHTEELIEWVYESYEWR